MQLRPCYEYRSLEDRKIEFRFLDGNLPEQEIWDFLVSLCEFATNEVPDSRKRTIEILLEQEDDEVGIGGGLAIITDEFRLFPGCCCGLEEWRDWENVKSGGSSPWLGHDPDAWVECLPSHAVVHADTSPEHETLIATYGDVTRALATAKHDLDSMLKLIEVVTSDQEICSKVGRWFSIHGNSTPPPFVEFKVKAR